MKGLWRPDDWNVHELHMKFVDGVRPPINDVEWDRGLIEAGADAMLVALKPILKQHYGLLKLLNEMPSILPDDD